MGQTQSSTSLSEVMSDYNANLTSLMNNVASTSSSTCAINNNVSISAGSFKGCNLDVSQTGKVVCNLAQTFTSSNSANLSTLMQNAANQTASAASTSLNGALALGTSNANTNISVKQAITNVIQTDIANNIANSCIASGEINNNFQIQVAGLVDCTGNPNAFLDLVQGGQMAVTANCVTTALTNALEASATYNSSSQAATGTSSATNEGAIDAIFSGISGIISSIGSLFSTPVLIALGVALLVCVGGVVLLKVLGHSNKSSVPYYTPYTPNTPQVSQPATPYTPYTPQAPTYTPPTYTPPAPLQFNSPISLQQIGGLAKQFAPQLEQLGPQVAKYGAVAASFA